MDDPFGSDEMAVMDQDRFMEELADFHFQQTRAGAPDEVEDVLGQSEWWPAADGIIRITGMTNKHLRHAMNFLIRENGPAVKETPCYRAMQAAL